MIFKNQTYTLPFRKKKENTMKKMMIGFSIDTIIEDLKNWVNGEYKTPLTKVVLEIIGDYIIANGEIKFINNNGDDITIVAYDRALGYYSTPEKPGWLCSFIESGIQQSRWHGEITTVEELLKKEELLREILITSSK